MYAWSGSHQSFNEPAITGLCPLWKNLNSDYTGEFSISVQRQKLQEDTSTPAADIESCLF